MRTWVRRVASSADAEKPSFGHVWTVRNGKNDRSRSCSWSVAECRGALTSNRCDSDRVTATAIDRRRPPSSQPSLAPCHDQDHEWLDEHECSVAHRMDESTSTPCFSSLLRLTVHDPVSRVVFHLDGAVCEGLASPVEWNIVYEWILSRASSVTTTPSASDPLLVIECRPTEWATASARSLLGWRSRESVTWIDISPLSLRSLDPSFRRLDPSSTLWDLARHATSDDERRLDPLLCQSTSVVLRNDIPAPSGLLPWLKGILNMSLSHVSVSDWTTWWTQRSSWIPSSLVLSSWRHAIGCGGVAARRQSPHDPNVWNDDRQRDTPIDEAASISGGHRSVTRAPHIGHKRKYEQYSIPGRSASADLIVAARGVPGPPHNHAETIDPVLPLRLSVASARPVDDPDAPTTMGDLSIAETEPPDENDGSLSNSPAAQPPVSLRPVRQYTVDSRPQPPVDPDRDPTFLLDAMDTLADELDTASGTDVRLQARLGSGEWWRDTLTPDHAALHSRRLAQCGDLFRRHLSSPWSPFTTWLQYGANGNGGRRIIGRSRRPLPVCFEIGRYSRRPAIARACCLRLTSNIPLRSVVRKTRSTGLTRRGTEPTESKRVSES